MRYLLAFFLTLAVPVRTFSQVIHDGSLGKAGTVTGTLRLIVPGAGPDATGKIVGQNVFYSFKQFDLAKNETARFLDPQNRSIRNILARVTSSKASSIDGTIEVTDPQVNLFMMNPAGFIFGPNARLDVNGSVLFTSADYIKLADKARFDAKIQVSPVLTSAAPAAFGFFGVQAPGAIRINGTNAAQTTLSVPDGEALSLVGGELAVSATRLVATSGRINLISVLGAGETKFDATNLQSPIDITGAPARGPITVSDGSSVRTALGGAVAIRGGSLRLVDSSVIADTDVVPGGPVDIAVSGRFESVRSQIDVATNGDADGGGVFIKADEVILRGQSIAGGLTTAISAESTGAGDSGVVIINARTIDISDHANIAASANDEGDGGRVMLTASERVTLDGSTGPQPLTGIISETVTTTFNAGDAGLIVINAPRVELLRNAQITSRTKSFGSAGGVEINCDQLLIDGTGTGSNSFTGIEARVGDNFGIDENGLGAPGDGGRVTINARDNVTLRKGGVITVSTFGLGDAGLLEINTGRLILRGATQHEFTGLFARTTRTAQAGAGGDIRLIVGALAITNRATISASSENSDGNAGGIIVNASGPISLSHGAAINVSSDRVNGGDIAITTSKSLSLRDNARIAASANINGGNIVIVAAKNLSLARSLITGRAGQTGGAITINTNAVSLGASTINGLAGGQDVVVRISGDLLQAIDSAILSDNATFSLDTNLASSLIPYGADIAGATARLQDFCGTRAAQISSFTVSGRGGLTLDPARAAPAP